MDGAAAGNEQVGGDGAVDPGADGGLGAADEAGHLYHEGAWWGRNPFPNADGTGASTNFTNFFFTITGFHGFHVFSGVVINIIMLNCN